MVALKEDINLPLGAKIVQVETLKFEDGRHRTRIMKYDNSPVQLKLVPHSLKHRHFKLTKRQFQ